MRLALLVLLFPLYLQAIDFKPDDYTQKGFKIICDEKTSEIVVTSEMHSEIWGTNLKTNNYELNKKYVNELQKKDRFFLPFDLKTSCTINGYHFMLKGAVPKRDPMGRCGYNPDPQVSILLNGKTIIDWVAFDETCMGDTSLVKIVLTLKKTPEIMFCLTEDIRPRDVVSTNNSCKTVKLNNPDLIPLTQDKLEILQGETHTK